MESGAQERIKNVLFEERDGREGRKKSLNENQKSEI